MPILTGIILIAIGLLACFAGKKLYRIILALLGFVIGFYIVSGLLTDQPDIIQIVVSIIGGVVGAVIFALLYKIAYVLFGLVLGLILAAVIVNAFNLDTQGIIALIVAVVLGLIGAVGGWLIGDLMIRVSTAFSGASQVVAGVAALAAALGISLPLVNPNHGAITPDTTAGIITIVAILVLGAVGYVVQTQNDKEAVI